MRVSSSAFDLGSVATDSGMPLFHMPLYSFSVFLPPFGAGFSRFSFGLTLLFSVFFSFVAS